LTERDVPEEALSLTVTRDTDRRGIERGRKMRFLNICRKKWRGK
jgi:hypothetical protein